MTNKITSVKVQCKVIGIFSYIRKLEFTCNFEDHRFETRALTTFPGTALSFKCINFLNFQNPLKSHHPHFRAEENRGSQT